jgi:hypothetical protein
VDCTDNDGDGYGEGTTCEGPDCNDNDADCHLEGDACCGECADHDGDGYGVGIACLGTDCNDSDSSCHELGDACCAACTDLDGDGYGVGVSCLGPDCNDADYDCHTLGEACCVDCVDNDGDGYGVGMDCQGLDCNDSDPSCYQPGDLCCAACTDLDGDGYGVGASCLGTDCDDANVTCWQAGASCCFLLEVSHVDPLSVSRDAGGEIVVSGENIDDGARVTLINCDTQDASDLGVAVVSAGGTSATVTLYPTPGLAQGLYQVRVTNPDLETDLSACELYIVAGLPPEIASVVPPFAWRGDPSDGILSDQLVTLDGTGFLPTPTVRFVLDSNPAVSFDAPLVSYIDDSQLTAVVPSESRAMPIGYYQVLVVNPNGLSGRWAGLFEVTSTPPPSITNVDPSRFPINECQMPYKVMGANFQDGAVVSLLVAPGTNCPDGNPPGPGDTCPQPTAFVSQGELDVSPTLCFTLGFYPVRVTNPDGQFATWFAVEVRDPTAGHLNDQFVPSTLALVTARERHDAVAAIDAFGNAYMLTAGGTNAANDVLDTVETSQVSVFGTPGRWSESVQYFGPTEPRGSNRMVTPRSGHAMVRVGRMIYAIGGAAQDTNTTTLVSALSSIERARILGYETMPQAYQPVAIGGNGLPVGSWFYRVSGVGPEGESLASAEVFLNNAWGRIRVCWSEVPGATSYNLYRSLAADGRAGTTRLLATDILANQGINCFVDDGQNHIAEGWYLTPAPGRLRGITQSGGTLAAGRWLYRVTAVRDGHETVAGYLAEVLLDDPAQASILLKWDAIPGATYNLYRVETVDGEREEMGLLVGGLTMNEHLDDGSAAMDDPTIAPPDGVAILPPGSLTYWEELPAAQHLFHPREGLDAVAVKMYDGDATTIDEPVFIYAVGGRPDNSGTNYHDSVERAQVLADGSLLPWIAEAERLSHPRAFLSVMTDQGQMDTLFPGQPEQPPCADGDGDGYTAHDCGGPDCDDTDPAINPGAQEICGDGIDQNCDGVDDACDCTDPDVDNDGYDSVSCGGDDCNDLDPDIHPDATEICDDGIDQDCDGWDAACDCSDPDADNDGYDSARCDGNDCDDTNLDIHPGAPEIPCDGIDQDCDGFDLCIIPAKGTVPSLSLVRIPVSQATRSLLRPSTTLWAPIVTPTQGIAQLAAPRAPLPALSPTQPALSPPSPPPPPPPLQEPTGPFHLVASLGAEAYGTTNGSDDFDVCAINPADGSLGPCDPGAPGYWALQDGVDSHDRRGHGGLLYFNYVYIIAGVHRDGNWGQEPTNVLSNVSRYPFDSLAADPSDFMGIYQSANANLQVGRGYFGFVRLSGKIFVFGGNDGTGPISSMEVNGQ